MGGVWIFSGAAQWTCTLTFNSLVELPIYLTVFFIFLFFYVILNEEILFARILILIDLVRR